MGDPSAGDPPTEVEHEPASRGWTRLVGRYRGRPFLAVLRLSSAGDLLTMLGAKQVDAGTSLEDATLALAASGMTSEQDLRCTYTANGAHVHHYPGDGPTVVLLHALAGNLHNWLPIATSLRGEVNLLLVDLPGHGRSASRLLGPPDRISDQVVDWLEEVLDELGVGDLHLVGHSLGGRAAAYYCALGRREVLSLTLLAPALRPALSGVRALASRAATVAMTLRRRRGARWVAGLVFFDMLIAHTRTNRRLVGYALDDMLHDQDDQGYGGLRLALAWLRARPDDADIDWPTITRRTPVQALFGEQDTYCPRSNHPAFGSHGVVVSEVPDTGHLLPLEVPELVLQRLRAAFAVGTPGNASRSP